MRQNISEIKDIEELADNIDAFAGSLVKSKKTNRESGLFFVGEIERFGVSNIDFHKSLR